MAKSAKTVVKNGKVRERASAAIADARRLAKELPKKHRKKLMAVAAELDDAAGVSDKKLTRHPKLARRLEKSTERLEKRLTKTRRRHSHTPDVKGPATGAGGATDAPATPSPTGAEGTTPPTAEESASEAEAPAVGASTLAAAQAATLPTSDLHSLTVFELRRRAKESGHRGFWSLTKAQLVALLS